MEIQKFVTQLSNLAFSSNSNTKVPERNMVLFENLQGISPTSNMGLEVEMDAPSNVNNKALKGDPPPFTPVMNQYIEKNKTSIAAYTRCTGPDNKPICIMYKCQDATNPKQVKADKGGYDHDEYQISHIEFMDENGERFAFFKFIDGDTDNVLVYNSKGEKVKFPVTKDIKRNLLQDKWNYKNKNMILPNKGKSPLVSRSVLDEEMSKKLGQPYYRKEYCNVPEFVTQEQKEYWDQSKSNEGSMYYSLREISTFYISDVGSDTTKRNDFQNFHEKYFKEKVIPSLK